MCIKKIGLFYGLSVSLRYALREASDLIKVAVNSKLTIFNRVSLSYTGNEQVIAGRGKDGEDTIRVSIAFSKKENFVTEFVNNYNYYIDKLIETNEFDYKYGEWKSIQEL